MIWEEAVEEAKEELGISGWTDEWDGVIEKAKEIYWYGQNFKDLKEDTIDNAGGQCELCSSEQRLTAHHIFYGGDKETMCVCKKCHQIIHTSPMNRYGFTLQLVLLNLTTGRDIPPNLYSFCKKVEKELLSLINRGSTK